MAFNIVAAMTDGFDRTRERNGLLLVVLFAVLAIGNALTTPTNLGPTAGTDATIGAVDLLTGLLSFAFALATLVAVIAALRTFVSDETETIPREFVRRNIGVVALNMIVGGIVFALLVGIGSVFLLVPGLFLLVSLYYWSVFVTVEEQNVIQAFRSSWLLTRGSRLRLFGLGVAVFAIAVVFNALVGLPAVLLGGLLGVVLTQVAGAVVLVFTIATTARAYDQLRHIDEPVEPDRQPEFAGSPA